MIDKTLKEIENHLDDPDWLSKACVYLSGQLFFENEEMAKAELEENRVAADLLEQALIYGKKLSVSESEKRAVVATSNKYGILKARGEATQEAINAIKARLKVLEWERNIS